MNALRQTINRAKQTVEEQLGSAVKTEYDPETQKLLQLADDLKSHTEKILSAVQVYVQPDPAVRLLPGLSQEGTNKPEQVAQEMSALGTKLGAGNNYGKCLLAAADAYNTIGKGERDFLSGIQTGYIVPTKRFLQEDIKLYDQERQVLHSRRLDMDALKGKTKSTGNTALELEKAQKAFDEQVEKIKVVVKKMEERLEEMRQYLKHYVEQQQQYLATSQRALEDLHKKL